MKKIYKFVILAISVCSGLAAKAQIPEFNSYPSSTSVIYLDFDGQTVSGTLWNTNGTINAATSGLTDLQITTVFNLVAEDYRPFNVNVTTSEAKYNLAPTNRRMRIIITTSHQWYPYSAGGVSYLNSFTWGDNTPSWVFTAALGYNIKGISEATAHEAGHTLGLRHQSTYDANCVKLSDYNWGYGAGEIGWAPIMGAGYNQNMTLWHNGPNSLGCSNYQTDLSVITNATNGVGYRTDDYNDVFASATVATFDANNAFTFSGVIEKTDDKDLIKFTLPAYGRFQMSAVPYNIGTGNSGSDLDLQVELLNSSYTSLGLYNPGNILNSVIDTLVNGGTYYIRIDGKGNIYAPEYGSLGSYSLQSAFTTGSALPLRRLELKGRLDGELHNLSWLIDADETVIKQVLEVSSNGGNFTPLDQPSNSLRSFSYRPVENKPLQYRLHVTLDNYKEYYSNVITIRQGKSAKPQLIGNTITGGSLSVNSPADYNYQVLDQNGRIISRGAVTKGFSSISAGTTTKGIYIVRFSNGEEQWTEKFIKQ